jgi:hypothetical protein
MAIFDIDADQAMDSVIQALEDAGQQMSQEKFTQIANAIESAMPGVIQLITQTMAEEWKSQASGAGGWGPKYAAAIKSKFSGTTGEVYLDESTTDKGSNKPNFMFAKMIEEGMKSFSIKDALLASDKAKVGKDGVKYITVPFPVATPRQASSGKSKSQFGGREMTNEIYNIVKSGGKISSAKLKSGQEISGLSKYNTRQLHGQYGIFRRVSEKSQGWIHPGRGASPVFPDVIKEVNNKIQEAIATFCKAVVEEFSK